MALERWRAACGHSLGDWVDAASEIEAICSLAGYAYEHPEDVFPELVDGGPAFDGRALGHPLLPADRCVRIVKSFLTMARQEPAEMAPAQATA